LSGRSGPGWRHKGKSEADRNLALGPKSAVPATHVKYVARGNPNMSLEEAAQAVASAKPLSTAFRVPADDVLPRVVAIKAKPKVVPAPTKSTLEKDNRGGSFDPFQSSPCVIFLYAIGLTPLVHAGTVDDSLVLWRERER
jgi:hypothetical protein